MTLLQALFLGVIQGITEFFPISSSGHLVIFQHLFGLKEPQVAFDVFLHLGTLVSILIFFRNEIITILTKDRRLIYYIILASIPTFIIGMLFKDAVEGFFGMQKVVGAMLLVNGIALILATVRSRALSALPVKDTPSTVSSLIVGIAQGIAIMPGISRSGSTIAAGILTGLKRETAFLFSFLLAIPAIAGASLVKAHKIGLGLTGKDALSFFAGGLVAMVVGLVSIRFLLSLVKGNKLHFFGIYCIAAGFAVLLFLR